MNGSDSTEALAREYGVALADYVHGAGEAALARAYELGREAAARGLGILDVAMLHHQALLRLPMTPGDRSPFGMATQFLIESLSPFEMTLRSYQANARLLGLAETLEQQNAEIDRSREQLRTILDATTAVIYLKDAQGRYLFVNRQFEQVFGLGREQVIGKSDGEVLPAPVARTLQSDDLRVLQARSPLQLEEAIPAGDGSHTFLSLKFPLLEPSGAPYGICCVATDITERIRADEERQRARAGAERERQLEEAVRARDRFLAIASHELKTPLTSLELQVGSLRRLARSEPGAAIADERVQEKCESIVRQVDRLTLLINNLLDVGRISTGGLELSLEEVELAEVVRAVLARSEEAIRRSGSAIVFAPEGAVVGRWDRSRLEAVVASLLSNAVKFGGGKPIEIATRAAGPRAILTVRDHGIGVPVEDQRRIFERFERAVSERHYGGFGIGLWVARQMVDAHGGEIRVRSGDGDGSEFSVLLPLDAARAAEPGDHASARPAPPGR